MDLVKQADGRVRDFAVVERLVQVSNHAVANSKLRSHHLRIIEVTNDRVELDRGEG